MEKLIQMFLELSNPDILIKYKEYFILIILLYSFCEVIFPPIPGDALLIISGTMAGAAGLNPIWIILIAWLGTFVASVLVFNFGARMEHRMLNSPRFSWFLDSKTFLKLELWFKRYGFWTLLFSRFLPVVRSGIILTAGMVELDKLKSLSAVGVSIFVSTTLYVIGGRTLGKNWREIIDIWHSWFKTALLIAVLILVLYLIIMNIVNFIKAKRSGADGNE